MNLAQFRDFLAQHGINLVLTSDGKIKPTAGQPPSAEVVEQIRAGVLSHRAQLLADLGEDSSIYSPSSAPKVAKVAINPPRKPDTQPLTAGTCAACAHWVALEGWGYNMGKCDAPLRYFAPGNGPGLAISAAHTCPSTGGAAWQARAAAPTKLDTQQAKGRELT